MPQQPGWGQQPGGMPPQQPGWGQQPGGMPQQPGWGQQQQPGWGQQPAWAPPAPSSQSSSRRPFLVILLIVLLIGLGTLTYFKTPIGTIIKDLLSGTGGATTADTTPPEITNVEATVGADVVINWETDELTSSQVEYGETDAYGSVFPVEPANDPSTGQSLGAVTHSVTLPKDRLGQEVTYNYRVKSKDAAGNEAVSPNKTFTTLGPLE